MKYTIHQLSFRQQYHALHFRILPHYTLLDLQVILTFGFNNLSLRIYTGNIGNSILILNAGTANAIGSLVGGLCEL